MKKFRLFLAATAVLFAIGGAFASRLTIQNPNYEWLSADEVCASRAIDCNTSGTVPCTLAGSAQLRKVNNPSGSCGALMFHP